MANINKDKFIQTYGINDDKFIEYLNKFGTLKKIVNMDRLDVVSKEKLNHLYNRFIYYNSLGHNLDTIVEETTPIIRNLFYFNGNGYFEYKLPDNNITLSNTNNSYITISGRVCQVKLAFCNNKELKAGDIIFNLIPAPVSEFRINVNETKSKNSISFIIDNDGIKYGSDVNLPINSAISDTFTYLFRK